MSYYTTDYSLWKLSSLICRGELFQFPCVSERETKPKREVKIGNYYTNLSQFIFPKWNVKLLCKSKRRLHIACLLKVTFDYLVISCVRLLGSLSGDWATKCNFQERCESK